MLQTTFFFFFLMTNSAQCEQPNQAVQQLKLATMNSQDLINKLIKTSIRLDVSQVTQILLPWTLTKIHPTAPPTGFSSLVVLSSVVSVVSVGAGLSVDSLVMIEKSSIVLCIVIKQSRPIERVKAIMSDFQVE
jgi:hypothetical protein